MIGRGWECGDFNGGYTRRAEYWKSRRKRKKEYRTRGQGRRFNIRLVLVHDFCHFNGYMSITLLRNFMLTNFSYEILMLLQFRVKEF